MIFLLTLPAVLSALLMGAHFLRAGEYGLVAYSLFFLPLLFLRHRWVLLVVRLGLAAASIEWLHTGALVVMRRLAVGDSWMRGGAILLGVAVFNVVAAWPLFSKRIVARYHRNPGYAGASAVTFVLISVLLGIVATVVSRPMLLPDRFWPGAGWVLVFAASVYGAWLVGTLLRARRSGSTRRKMWLFFSVVFFWQLLFGLAGLEQFLMSGTLHLPVPAVIVAGPLYRGHGLFMPILFGVTLLLVGPAWCSFLCYIGAWDNWLAAGRKRPVTLPRWAGLVRLGILVFVVGAALILRALGVSGLVAAGLGLAFGLAGVGVMVTLSRKLGAMVHCVVYCPIGLLANWAGRLSPFRIRIKSSCTDCGACSVACRFNALDSDDIARRQPGLSCTLCGDCLGRCGDGSLEYRWMGLGGSLPRTAFFVLVVALHAVFLSVARI